MEGQQAQEPLDEEENERARARKRRLMEELIDEYAELLERLRLT